MLRILRIFLKCFALDCTCFSSLMRSDMKNINRKVLGRFGMGRVFETLRQEKKFKIVLLGLSENNFHAYWFGSM